MTPVHQVLDASAIRNDREDVRAVCGADDSHIYDGGPGATPYVEGTLLAIRRVREFTGVVRGMDRLL
jgi:hypothetical protein